MPKIHITTTDGTTLEFTVGAERSRIGRAEDNDFVVLDSSVSSYHGEVSTLGEGILLQDLGSTNGTHFNGERVERAEIPAGGTFRLGSCEAAVEGNAEVEASPVEEEYVEEEAAPSGDWASSGRSVPAAVISGLGSTPCPTNLRKGFGAKTKKKDSGGGLIMMLAVLSLLACAAAAFMILKMGA
jgi:pSer/pThr/pTyr-binding forkhead associated (FHA) protein